MKTLFEPPIAHRGDPETSYEAGQKMIDSGELSRQEQWVLEQIQNSMLGEFTALELARGIKDNLYSKIQRRLSGLRTKGKIERLNTEGGVYIENTDQELKKRDGCAVWRLL